jgi:AAA domain
LGDTDQRDTRPPATVPTPESGLPRDPNVPEPVLISLADVVSEPVTWLWPNRIALGKQSNIVGDPGVGKSLMTLDIAARVSRGGVMPDGTRGDLFGIPSGVIILSAEDDPADTIKPRLIALGGDVTQISVLPVVKDPKGGSRFINLDDRQSLAEAVDRVHARLVIVDPLSAYMPAKADMYKEQHVRLVLAPLCSMVTQFDFALLIICHLTKPGESSTKMKAIYRSGGSMAIAGNSRSLLIAGKDEGVEGRCLLAHVKNNLGPEAATLAYHMEEVIVEETIKAPILVWDGEVTSTADDLSGATSGEGTAPEKVEEAVQFLQAHLADGPRPSGALMAQGCAAGLSDVVLRRAKVRLGLKTVKTPAGWSWSLK